MHSTIKGAPGISVVLPPNPGFISLGFRGSPEGDPLSFGGSGTMPSTLQTALPRSADISNTMLRQTPRIDDGRWRDNDVTYQNSEIQHEGHLSRTEARQRLVSGSRYARRTNDLSARPMSAGPGHCQEHRTVERRVRRYDGAFGQGGGLPDRRPPSGSGVPHHGRVH